MQAFKRTSVAIAALACGLAQGDDPADANRLFDLAEKFYPQYFSPPGANTQEISGYLARHYQATGNYIGTLMGEVYVYGPEFGNDVVGVGRLTDHMAISRVIDTGQVQCYDNLDLIDCPQSDDAFYGQDAQFAGHTASYKDNGDGTVSDLVTELMWQQTIDSNGDGDIDADDKLSASAAQNYCADLTLGDHDDWRLPDIKQLYSLIMFNGRDISGYNGSSTDSLTPFIDTRFFAFDYGDTAAGERLIDAQYASSTFYVANTANDGGSTLFGVNFADGRIKGYGTRLFNQDKTFYVQCVRGNNHYGENDLIDNGDGTISDNASGLMWAKADSGDALDWEQALAWAVQQNAKQYLGYDNWRLPNAKELQGLVDYSRAPDTTASAAIKPLFQASMISNEAGEDDYPAYWSGTTHGNWSNTPGRNAVYINFGRSMGYMNNDWVDVHGAGAQRSDPKTGDPADYPTGHGPQGDAIRIYNHARLVRDMD